LSALVKYASAYRQAKSFDNFNQVSKETIEYFYKRINLDPAKTLLSIEGVLKYKPNVMSVCGNWVSDLSLYEQPSLKFLLSDTLYNSGRIKGQGVYYYNKFWKTPPEKFGFKLIAQVPLLDVFYRS
jgi:hypothetical protein